MSAYIKLGIAALLPVALSILFYILSKHKNFFSRLPYMAQQVIIGVSFGALACLGTHWGIEMHGAMVNARDAAVLISGLMFGSPAGIIAGVIGGLERYLATQIWGIGAFTAIACSVSTFLAGLYAAALRRFMFDNKRPGWLISLAMGVFIEVFHLSMIFVTHMKETDQAMSVVKACTAPMLIANGLAVMLSAMALSLLSGEKGKRLKYTGSGKISQRIQRELLVTIIVTLIFSFAFIALFQTGVADNQADLYLKTAIEEVRNDINDTSDGYILTVAKQAASDYENGASVQEIVEKYYLTEASYINNKGVITESSNPDFVRYNMAGAVQSKEFLVILEGAETYVQPVQRIGYDRETLRKYGAAAVGDGFLQIGYDVEKFHDIISASVVGITKNRHVGENGYIIILDSNYELVSAPKDFDIELLNAQAQNLKNSKEGKTFRMKLGEEKVFARATKTEGYAIISIFPESEAYATRSVALYLNTFAQVLMFALLFTFIYYVIKHSVVNQIKKVNSSLTKITHGDLEETVNVRSSAEFASLSDDINATVNALKGYIDEAEKKMEEELEVARTIQHSALPSLTPLRKEFDIYASMNTAKEVGGDFYDFYVSESGHKLCILIADVSGKGIPAAMFMMRAKSLFKNFNDAGMSVTEAFNAANVELCEGNDAGMFVTVWAGMIDMDSGEMSYANAGHNPPIVRREGGLFKILPDRAGFVLAGMEEVRYKEQNYVFRKGDQIFLYTDGVTEAHNPQGELFGEKRLLEALNSAADTSAKGLCQAVKQAVEAFREDAAQFDDITMLALTYEGSKEDTPPQEI